jgi:hypothetical protein
MTRIERIYADYFTPYLFWINRVMKLLKGFLMRKSTIFFSFIILCGLLLSVILFSIPANQEKSRATIASNAKMVRELKLTDLSLFTEARYTRHSSMADLHSAFQDHPLALDHFPSGSLVTPPRFRHEAP